MNNKTEMKHLRFAILALAAIMSLGATAQEERIDTVIPKYLINGYFFREMPKLPDAEKTFSGLKDKEGNRVINSSSFCLLHMEETMMLGDK